jgi:GNAT superfamily N-acetyltransferase
LSEGDFSENDAVHIPIDGTLDLHNFSPRDLKHLVPDYIDECRRAGIFQVRIIHGKGIGSTLINRGITEMRKLGAKGIVLLGSPEYYVRFGFKSDEGLSYPGPPAEYFQYLDLEGPMPHGIVTYAAAFG